MGIRFRKSDYDPLVTRADDNLSAFPSITLDTTPQPRMTVRADVHGLAQAVHDSKSMIPDELDRKEIARDARDRRDPVVISPIILGGPTVPAIRTTPPYVPSVIARPTVRSRPSCRC